MVAADDLWKLDIIIIGDDKTDMYTFTPVLDSQKQRYIH
jgi:hypothetical protein